MLCIVFIVYISSGSSSSIAYCRTLMYAVTVSWTHAVRCVTDWHTATRHFQEMTELTKCHKPVAELIDVRAMQREANRDYLPSCTIVYRCPNHLACCDRSSECAVKTSNVIVKSFIVSTFCIGWSASE